MSQALHLLTGASDRATRPVSPSKRARHNGWHQSLCITTPCVPLANAARLTTRNALNNSRDAFFCRTAVSVVDRFKPTPPSTETHWQRLDQLEVRLRDIRKYLWTAKQANKAELKGGKRKYIKKKKRRKEENTVQRAITGTSPHNTKSVMDKSKTGQSVILAYVGADCRELSAYPSPSLMNPIAILPAA